MHYGCSIYGLGVLANRPIPTVPHSTITTADVRVSFGVLPDWFAELQPHQVETTYVADYTDVNFDTPNFVQFSFAPTWGGVSGVGKAQDDYYRLDHVYLSRP